MEPTRAQQFHRQQADDFASRHFSDPQITADDAAVYAGVSTRTLRESLDACGTTWRAMLGSYRIEYARQLLRTTKYEIWAVARMCGYDSAPAFAAAFKRQAQDNMAPHQFRRAFGGPARAGGPTGAFYRPAKRARALREGEMPPPATRSRGRSASEDAVLETKMREASERLDDRSLLEFGRPRRGVSIAELSSEIEDPVYLRNRADHWRARKRAFDQWIAEQNEKSIRDAEDLTQDGEGNAQG
jgi:AraC-like DNA-binding protein